MLLGIDQLFHKSRKIQAQSFFEYTLGIIAAVLLMYGMIQVFLWVGRDQVQRILAHDHVLLEDVRSGCGGTAACPLRQIRPSFYYPDSFDAAKNGDIYGDVQARFTDYTH